MKYKNCQIFAFVATWVTLLSEARGQNNQGTFTAELFWNRNALDSGLYEGHVTGRKLFGGTQIPNGRGTIYYFQTDKFHRQNYTGDWINGTRHGNGTTHFRDGSHYTGQYTNGVEEGPGTIIYSDGNILEGDFRDGKIDGHAVFRYPNGDQREGFFRENQLDGQVIYTRADGRTIIEVWTNGEQVKGKDQLVNPGTKEVKETSSNLSHNLSLNLTIEVNTTKHPQQEEEKPVPQINQSDEAKSSTTNAESATIEDPIPKNSVVKDPTQTIKISNSNPGETQDIFLSKLRSAIRSGDKNTVFRFGVQPVKTDRQPKDSNPGPFDVNAPDVDIFKQLRKETEEKNRQFLMAVFHRVAKNVR